MSSRKLDAKLRETTNVSKLALALDSSSSEDEEPSSLQRYANLSKLEKANRPSSLEGYVKSSKAGKVNKPSSLERYAKLDKRAASANKNKPNL